MNLESQFRDAMRNAGIPTEATIVADGELHRVHVEGDRQGTRNGWFVLHDGNHLAGAYGCNKRGISGKWRANNTVPNTGLNPVDRAHIEAQRQARATEQERGYTLAADRAGKILHAATLDATAHPYTVRKCIQPFGVNQNRDGVLVVPVYDARNGKLSSLQFIDGDGTKRMLTGGRMAYGCFPLRHTPESFKQALQARIGIAEGYATCATLSHVVGDSVAMFSAFSAANLPNVALALREHYPSAEITLYADNDANEVGQRYATKAAIAVHGLIAIPPTPGADWNDEYARATA